MMQFSLATRSQRITASLINLLIGVLPVVIPNMLFPARGAPTSWTSAEINLLAAVLTLIQLIFVHRMDGSPGSVYIGLKVQNLDGSKPLFTATLTRSIPYLMMVVLIMAKRNGGPTNYPDPLAVVTTLTVLFLVLNSATLLVTGKHSILDLVTKTQVVKAYNIGN